MASLNRNHHNFTFGNGLDFLKISLVVLQIDSVILNLFSCFKVQLDKIFAVLTLTLFTAGVNTRDPEVAKSLRRRIQERCAVIPAQLFLVDMTRMT